MLDTVEGQGCVHLSVDRDTGVATLTLENIGKLNAITPGMIADIHTRCDEIDADPAVRMLVVRGAGGTFSSGSDITEFARFVDGRDGVEYDMRFVELVGRVESVSVPTVALVEGACAGAGLVIAAACDIRVATDDAYFALPIARTLGNTLSAYPLALLADKLGESTLMSLVVRAHRYSVIDAAESGFVTEIVAEPGSSQRVNQIFADITGVSAVTIVSVRETMRRQRLRRLADTTDLVFHAYGSAEFMSSVRRFLGDDDASDSISSRPVPAPARS
ncbi:enoyl-CoA hydratase-related protein [Gordonia humi]|uniref:Enoyl-CoA hydratase/carnithine racemase n=1 Tax=Gordonia humi TaxID=686429 RepID=A0A840EVX2_9ACTN|nr:enoyl-CoA hydratase-related protein [Gordonia humi]MBB4135701.1 enoyl-CoA hydratase/carnithine racemase [Gordonia humi]